MRWLAGAGGFEPPYAGIKIRCLTAWRRPHRGGRGPYWLPAAYSTQDVPCQAAMTDAGAWPIRPACRRLPGPGSAYISRLPAQNRRVAQPGRALASGARGRRFESSLSDQRFKRPRPAAVTAARCLRASRFELRSAPRLLGGSSQNCNVRRGLAARPYVTHQIMRNYCLFMS
jgi:hypothetical protein